MAKIEELKGGDVHFSFFTSSALLFSHLSPLTFLIGYTFYIESPLSGRSGVKGNNLGFGMFGYLNIWIFG